MAGAFSTREDYLGEGGKKWREAFIHGVLTGSLRAGEGELYGGLGAIAQGTWGTVMPQATRTDVSATSTSKMPISAGAARAACSISPLAASSSSSATAS